MPVVNDLGLTPFRNRAILMGMCTNRVASWMRIAASLALGSVGLVGVLALSVTGSPQAGALNAPVVGLASTPTGHGYWEVASDGGLFALGNAGFYGSMGGHSLNAPIVGMATMPTAGGYWEVASDGGLFSFGTAQFYGSMGGHPLNKPIVGLAATPDGKGYWEVASDGGVFAFGSAQFYGSMGGHFLDRPIVGITAISGGYWEVASDGGLFAFGSAQFYGSMGGRPLNAPIVGMTATPTGNGYWEVASDGGLFAFGTAQFYGSMGGQPLNAPIVGMVSTADGRGYWFVASDGGIFSFGDAQFYGNPSTGNLGGQTPPATSTHGTTPPPTPIITYQAYVDPTFTQNTTNPLTVTYAYSASAARTDDGVKVGLSDLPPGILNFYSNGILECSLNVGTRVTGGTCNVKYTNFGTDTVVTEYIPNNTTAVSTTQVVNIAPFSTNINVTASGGGALGGLVFDAAVTVNTRPVKTGDVTFMVSDQTEHWSYVVRGVVGEDGGHPTSSSCLFVENFPTTGEYSGCGLFGPVTIRPVVGQHLTVSAVYGGSAYNASVTSADVTYTMPS